MYGGIQGMYGCTLTPKEKSRHRCAGTSPVPKDGEPVTAGDERHYRLDNELRF